MAILTEVTTRFVPSLLKITYVLSSALIIYTIYTFLTSASGATALPIVGVPKGVFGRLKAGFSTITNAHHMLDEGYSRFSVGGQAFRIPMFFSGYITVLPPSLIPELKSAPENMLSMNEAFEDESSTAHTFSPRIHQTPYHLGLLRKNLTQNLGRILGPLEDEVATAFKEEWDPKFQGGDEWTEVKPLDWILKIVARASHRTFVGLPLCRNDHFLQTCTDFSGGVVLSGLTLRAFPTWFRRFVAPIVMIRNAHRVKIIQRYLDPVIDERMKIIEHNLDPANEKNRLEEPNDLLQWILQTALPLGPEHCEKRQITIRVLLINFAAIHTTSLSFADAILNLASCTPSPYAFSSTHSPSTYYDDLTSEVLAVQKENDGTSSGTLGPWDRKKLSMLVGLDSFLKETLRLYSVFSVGLTRKVLAKGGYTFADGLHVREGDLVCVSAKALQLDTNIYRYADRFDGWRFSKPFQVENDPNRESVAGEESEKRSGFVTTTDYYVSFGHGKHACPGRFFAANELKLIFKYILLNYELRPSTATERPKSKYFWVNRLPCADAVSMRKRKMALV